MLLGCARVALELTEMENPVQTKALRPIFTENLVVGGFFLLRDKRNMWSVRHLRELSVCKVCSCIRVNDFLLVFVVVVICARNVYGVEEGCR